MNGRADSPRVGVTAKGGDISCAVTSGPGADGQQLFVAGPIELRKRRIERIASFILLLVTTALVLPLVAILSYLLVRAWPVLSWSFLMENPKHYMTAGGLWAPLVGTFDVVVLSLAIAAPVGP